MAGRTPRLAALAAVPALILLSACGPSAAPVSNDQGDEDRIETVDIPQTVTAVAPGTTPMAERVAVIGLLNKRNGLSRDLTLRPGQAARVGDVIVRLRACETTAPWEVQRLTGAFVQVDVRNAQDQFQRVFSGWLYKETPSLNVVEHPIYDVWPKSCEMTHPEGQSSGAEASNRSSASNSAAPAASAPAAPAAAPPEGGSEAGESPSAEANATR